MIRTQQARTLNPPVSTLMQLRSAAQFYGPSGLQWSGERKPNCFSSSFPQIKRFQIPRFLNLLAFAGAYLKSKTMCFQGQLLPPNRIGDQGVFLNHHAVIFYFESRASGIKMAFVSMFGSINFDSYAEMSISFEYPYSILQEKLCSSWH